MPEARLGLGRRGPQCRVQRLKGLDGGGDEDVELAENEVQGSCGLLVERS